MSTKEQLIKSTGFESASSIINAIMSKLCVEVSIKLKPVVRNDAPCVDAEVSICGENDAACDRCGGGCGINAPFSYSNDGTNDDILESGIIVALGMCAEYYYAKNILGDGKMAKDVKFSSDGFIVKEQNTKNQ